MARFLIRRIFPGLIVMWLMTVTVFIIFFIGPGPAAVARTLAGREATPAQVAAVSHRLLLDRPLPRAVRPLHLAARCTATSAMTTTTTSR